MKYVTNVESYDRCIESSINNPGMKMQRRAEFLLTRALRQAGWGDYDQTAIKLIVTSLAS